jgi:hypothetical protein
VREKAAGKERLKVVLKGFRAGMLTQQLGDPRGGETAYHVCIYDDADTLAGALTVDRAGDSCGSKPCWKALGSTGWKYRDAQATSDGVSRLIAKSGSTKARVIVSGRNQQPKGLTSLPTGIAAALSGGQRATVRVLTSDADCFGTTLDRVRKDSGTFFKATAR